MKALLGEQFDVVVPDTTAVSLEDELVLHIRSFLDMTRRSSHYANLQSAAPALPRESSDSPLAAALAEGSLPPEANMSFADWPNLPAPGTTAQGERARPVSQLTNSDATSAFLTVNQDGRSGRQFRVR